MRSTSPPLPSGLPTLDVVMVAPRGFCAGVRRAIRAVEDALDHHGAPVYVRRAIVHNLEVVRSLETKGAVFVEELDEVPEGGIVIFSAHGVAPEIAAEARRRGLKSYDAVCPLVAKVHREVERHQRNGREIVLIGHEGHPEIQGTVGRLRSAHLVQHVTDVEALPIAPDAPVAYAVQTTYSESDAAEIVEALRRSFQDLEEPATSDICYATTNRQRAITDTAGHVDGVIVVGEHFSSNACRLTEVAAQRCRSVQLAAGPHELNWDLLSGLGSVAITAAASTPETSVAAIVEALRSRFTVRMSEQAGIAEQTMFKPVAIA
ncbi:4-hydroxy-3-methylbut-2-enyl diphosphate reductase [Sphingomonas piscis]|uniref:4-hydroxy-3-methylbut-2-enyl diphosphate reductase n=1 Tax=Sphingomonas piscis TaxID=2714943 RepID=A0A6G7YSD8_9SPHN|nr:4-hydroxy-3-methylbut-2-enyl diphosphate reductase [Sphingomonas piscis]QIK79652.1 4-hydroxy-3-methylbut-2-enyl diphosphate reductase [Sphingomonas piscis]